MSNQFFRKYSDIVVEAERANQARAVEPPEWNQPENPMGDYNPAPGLAAMDAAQQRYNDIAGGNVPQPTPRPQRPSETPPTPDARMGAPRNQRSNPDVSRPAGAPDSRPGPYSSNNGVTAQDPRRVQVAPNVQQSVLDYERQKAEAERNRTERDRQQHPYWDQAGQFIGDVIGGAKSRWNALTGAADNAIDTQTGRGRYPDPVKPVDVIPNPRHGTATPRMPQTMKESTEMLRTYSDLIKEAEKSKKDHCPTCKLDPCKCHSEDKKKKKTEESLTSKFFREYEDMLAERALEEAKKKGNLSEPLVLKSVDGKPVDKPDEKPTQGTGGTAPQNPTPQPTGPNAPKPDNKITDGRKK